MSSQTGGNGGASLFTPAYRVSRPDGAPMSGHGWQDSDGGQREPAFRRGAPADHAGDPLWPGQAGYGDLDDAAWPGSSTSRTEQARPALSRAVRGFPPKPGDPLPVYPPGPFAAWNRSPSDRRGQRGRERSHTSTSRQIAAATITPDEFDTDYSLPAIKDPPLGGTPRQADRSAPPGTRVRERGARAEAGRDSARRPRSGTGRPADRKPAARNRTKRPSAWLAIAAAVAIIIAGTVILVLTTRSSPPASPKAKGTPTPIASSPTPPAGRWEYIGTRSTDTAPLTIRELYPATFTAAGTTYTKVSQARGGNCGAALIGSALKSAVRRGGCTQAVRATYVARAAGVMATIGVFNLDTATGAVNAATKAGHFDFVAQLQAKSGPASKIGRGTGIEEAPVKGHYLVLVWAEYTNLKAPRNKAGRAKLEAFMHLLITRTANVGLSYRMVYGKPAG